MKRLGLVLAFCVALAGSALAQGGMGPGPGTVHSTGGGGGNVTADVVGTQKYQASSNSFSYTGLTITGSLTNPGLVCWLARADGSSDVTAGVTLSWGAQAMTLRTSEFSAVASGVWLFGLRNPTSGNQTLTVSGTNSARDNFVNCTSFFNVNQASDAAAFPNPTGTQTATSINVTSASGHIAAGVFENGSVTGTIIGTVTLQDNSSGALISAGGDYVASSGASTTVGASNSQVTVAGMDISN